MTKPLFALAAVFAFATTLTADDAAAKDLKKLVGTWQEVKHTADGKDMPADEIKDMTVTFDEKGNWEAKKGDTVFVKGTVKLDPSKSPKQADYVLDGSDMKALGIYEVDGDTWKHCFALGETRPTEFASKEGSQVHYVVLKRVKK